MSGKLFKYELPVVNEEISFRSKAALVKAEEKETLTFTEKLFDAFESGLPDPDGPVGLIDVRVEDFRGQLMGPIQ